jgi:hypothetical protein
VIDSRGCGSDQNAMKLTPRPSRILVVARIGFVLGAALVLVKVLSPLQSVQAAPMFPLSIATNHRYLVDRNNTPFFFSGDAPWSIIAQGTNADIDYYLANRQQKGVNVIVVNLIEHKYANNAPRDIAGDPPFTGTPFSTPNEPYFAHADYLVSQAAQTGMVVLLDALYLDRPGVCQL